MSQYTIQELTAELRALIAQAESIDTPSPDLDYALSNARGTLAAIDNPPRNPISEWLPSNWELSRAVFNIRINLPKG